VPADDFRVKERFGFDCHVKDFLFEELPIQRAELDGLEDFVAGDVRFSDGVGESSGNF